MSHQPPPSRLNSHLTSLSPPRTTASSLRAPTNTDPSLVTYFLEEVKDGTVSDSSLDTAKKWMDATGKAPYYINPVNKIMFSEHDLSLTMHDNGASR